MATAPEEEGGLSIGDTVTLFDGQYQSFLGAEGILMWDVTANPVSDGTDFEVGKDKPLSFPKDFDDNLVSIHLQRQYSAARELQSFRDNYHIDENGVLDDATKKYMAALENGCNNEVRLNNIYLQKQSGKSLHFGDVVQLFHLKSQKYLTVDPKQLATYERENSRLVLTVDGNIYSWLKLMPRYKIDRVGDRIRSGADVYISVVEKPSEFIRVADVAPRPGFPREVNCSLIMTSWKIDLFQCHTVSLDESLVLASQLVYIFDPETLCNMAIAFPPLESLDDNDGREEGGEGLSAAEGKKKDGEEGGGRQEPMNEDKEEDHEGAKQEEEYIHEHGNIVVQPAGEGIADSRTIWQLEPEVATSGGPILWKAAKIRLRNVSTGLYLYMKARDEEAPMTHENCVVITTRDTTLPGTLFSFYEPNSPSKYLRNLKALSINCEGVWLGRGEAIEVSFSVRSVATRNASLNFVINPLKLAHPHIFEAGGPLDCHTCMNAKKYFSRYLQMTVVPTNNSISTLWPTAERSDIPFFNRLFESLTNFSQGYHIDAENVQLGVDPFDPVVRAQRQRLLKELDVLEMAVRIIHRLIPISVTMENQQLKKTKLSEEEENMLRMGNTILNTVFKFVFYCILDNPDNQMFVVTFLKVLLKHLSTQKLAGKCVTEMLSKNMELQETKIGAPEISIFVEKLRTSKMNSMYLNLLQSCCSCEGQGVDNNQGLVAELLFADTNDIIIELHTDFAKSVLVPWNKDSIYIPNPPIPGSPMLGDVLMTRGLPLLSLAWTTNAIDYSPLGLFGKLSVNVSELYSHQAQAQKVDSKKALATHKEKSTAQIKLEEKKNALASQKAAVASYFINEMFLGAEMCMDRNYIAMHKLDPYFSFEALVTILKMDVQESVKAGAARLLLCLHIDRDPQAETKIPCLTRAWSDVEKNETPVLPYVDLSRRYVYGLVQEIVSGHVKSMAGRKWEPYSKYMLEILLAMAKFNFYGTIDRMHDIIYPLIEAVDRRNVNYVTKKLRAADDSDGPMDMSTNLDESAEGGKDEAPAVPWQKPLLEFLESLPVTIFVLALVIAAVSTTIYQVLSSINDPVGSPLYIWGLVVTIVFIIDYLMRFYCSVWLYGQPLKFVTNAFNVIDALVILLDIVFLALPPTSGSSLTKTLRLIRLVRMLRIFRAAKVIQLVQNRSSNNKEEADNWVLPARYSKIPISEMETVMQAQNVLLFVQSVIEDRNLSLLLRYFYSWECGNDKRTPGEIFDQVVLDSSELTLGVKDFDLIFIDLLMMPYKPLVQGSLDVLMAHHSMRETLLENAGNVQILVSAKRQRQFKIVDQMLQQLERNAETHELWGELRSDSDHMTSKQTKDILVELTDISRVRRVELEFDEEFYADKEIQNLYRNLGCFTICFKMLGLLDSVEEDENGELDEVGTNTHELCLLTNELLYWFCLDNPLNQELGYSELEFFVSTLDSKIKSHKVIRAIFRENETLMKLVPHSYLAKVAENVAKLGQFHQYLALPASITHVGEKNFTKNQFEIMKTMTAHGKLETVACFLVPTSHADYKEKQELMAQVKGYVDFEDLPPKLAYHFALLELFSNCTVGRINITSVEAKVQSIYSYEDVLHCLLDPASIVLAKTRLGLHFFNSFVEVEISIPGIEASKLVWELIATFPSVLEEMRKDLIFISQVGWSGNQYIRQKIEYGIVCIKIIYGFFGRYYDSNALESKEGATLKPGESPLLSLADALALITELWRLVLAVYEMRSGNLSQEHKDLMHDALEALNKSAPVPFVDEVDISFTQKIQEEEAEFGGHHDEAREREVHERWSQFLQELSTDKDVSRKIASENRYFISNLEGLPFIADDVESDVRYESLIQALVKHITNSITLVNGEKRIDQASTKTSIWIIKAFRTMIENKMGMTIYERDDEGGEEQDVAAESTVTALNVHGGTALCLELIAVGIDEELQNEAVKLLVGMLFKEGGAREVQSMVHRLLTEKKSDLFFKQVRATIGKLIGWHKWHGIILLEEGQEPEPPDDILIIRMLQLLSEGHYGPNQDIMREQPNNFAQVNLLDDFVLYLNTLSRMQCQTSTNCAIRVAATILEVIQGPSRGNQEHLAMNTDLLEVMNRIMRLKDTNDCVPEEEVELKKTVVDIFEALLEGRQRKDVVVERIISVIHVDIIQFTAKGEASPDDAPEGSEDLAIECGVLMRILSDFKPTIKVEAGLDDDDVLDGSKTTSVELSWDGVLNRRFFPIPEVCSLLAKSSKDALVAAVDRSNTENQLINFLSRTEDLYREAKHQERLVEMGVARIFSTANRDRATWITFILAWVQNGIFIAYYNVRDSWANPNIPPFPCYKLGQNGGAILDCSNIDKTNPGGYFNPSMPENIMRIAMALNIVQICFAAFTVILTLVVRSPVIAQKLEKEGFKTLQIILGTASDPMTVYYFTYLLFSILGTAVDSYWISLLLLDILVKNETTASVAAAVWEPRQQLSFSILLGVFFFYIFANFMVSCRIFFLHPPPPSSPFPRSPRPLFPPFSSQFRYYQNDFVVYPNLCKTLYDCTKFEMNYGLQMGGGPADLMVQTNSARMWMDILYFILVIVIWLNITFGIIIDTFSSLRAARDQRLMKTTEFCFICGISKQTFDRSSDKPDGFKAHIKEDHNMWSYVNFIFFVWEQDKDDDDGLEYYVRHKIEDNEITWFPMNKAMRLQQAETTQTALANKLKASIGSTRENFGTKLGGLQTDVGSMLDKLSHLLRESNGPVGSVPGRGDGTSPDDDEGEWYPALGYNVFASVKEVRGIDAPPEDLALLMCRLISDSGIYSTDGATVDPAHRAAVFASDNVLVSENAQPADKGASFQIQILQGSKAGASKFVAVVEVSVSEILQGETSVNLEKTFHKMGQLEVCSVLLQASWAQARKFTRGDEEDD